VVTPGKVDRYGYRPSSAERFGKRITYRHRLAWIDAHGMLPPPETPWILHHCDNPPCENALHLYAGTPEDNTRDRWRRTGNKAPRRSSKPYGYLNAELVRVIRARRERGVTVSAMAREYGVARATIAGAINGRTWNHVQ
jgi:hypothetical protein